MQYGAYVELLTAAQADTDPAHRQIAMDELTRIAPFAGSTRADGSCSGDALAAPVLARLYPRPQPEPPMPPALAALIEEQMAKARALIDEKSARGGDDSGPYLTSY